MLLVCLPAFRLVEFMMIDEDGDGTVEFDEAAKIFRARYGEPSVCSVSPKIALLNADLDSWHDSVRLMPCRQGGCRTCPIYVCGARGVARRV